MVVAESGLGEGVGPRPEPGPRPGHAAHPERLERFDDFGRGVVVFVQADDQVCLGGGGAVDRGGQAEYPFRPASGGGHHQEVSHRSVQPYTCQLPTR